MVAQRKLDETPPAPTCDAVSGAEADFAATGREPRSSPARDLQSQVRNAYAPPPFVEKWPLRGRALLIGAAPIVLWGLIGWAAYALLRH